MQRDCHKFTLGTRLSFLPVDCIVVMFPYQSKVAKTLCNFAVKLPSCNNCIIICGAIP